MYNWLAKLLGIKLPTQTAWVDISPDLSKFKEALDRHVNPYPLPASRDYSRPLTLWEEDHPAFASAARLSSQAGLASIQRWTGNYWERPTDTPIYDELRAMADLEDEARA